MKRRIWKIKGLSAEAGALASKYNLSSFLIQILLNRNISENNFNSFLNPGKYDFHNPRLLPDIEKAVERIKQAAEDKEKVLVFGDYDVDGITSLAIFHEYSKKFPKVFSFYIPHRVKEGYGINKEAILRAKEEAVTLLIAFDCGTNSASEIELATSLGIDTVVIDHHYVSDNLIKPFAFVNPKREGSSYPFSDLSTGAIAFKLLQLLTDSNCFEVLDLVALSLVCDVVPLNGENRSLLKEGLEVIRKSNRLAIKALCDVSSLKQENLDTFHIGYILGPRINASGRVAHSKYSLDLFLTEDQKKAEKLALKLSEYNKLRRVIETQILKEAEQAIKNDINQDCAIVVSGQSWHPGVLGIVASRLAGKYNRPSFVISFEEDLGKGSARSIHSVHLLEMLDKCADSLIGYGGHKKAAGVKISRDNLDSFKTKINALIEEDLAPEDFVPITEIDAELSFDNIEDYFVQDLEKLAPYGEGNSKPLFTTCGVILKSTPKKIKTGHSVWVSDGQRTFEAAVYNKDIMEVINFAERFDIVFSLQMNYYHNIPMLIIRDCRLSGDEG